MGYGAIYAGYGGISAGVQTITGNESRLPDINDALKVVEKFFDWLDKRLAEPW